MTATCWALGYPAADRLAGARGGSGQDIRWLPASLGAPEQVWWMDGQEESTWRREVSHEPGEGNSTVTPGAWSVVRAEMTQTLLRTPTHDPIQPGVQKQL